MGMKRLYRVAAMTGALALSACVSLGGDKPPEFLLSITADEQVTGGSEISGAQSGALVVRLPSTPQKLNNLRVPVQTSSAGVAYLKDAVWVDKPARLFQGLLVETISAKNESLVLTSAQAGGQAETSLSGELVEFGLDGPSLTVTVTFDAVKIRDGQPIEKRRFQESELVFEAAAKPVGEALNIAANKIAGDIADWMK